VDFIIQQVHSAFTTVHIFHKVLMSLKNGKAAGFELDLEIRDSHITHTILGFSQARYF
jgi:hypothetical protein